MAKQMPEVGLTPYILFTRWICEQTEPSVSQKKNFKKLIRFMSRSRGGITYHATAKKVDEMKMKMI